MPLGQAREGPVPAGAGPIPGGSGPDSPGPGGQVPGGQVPGGQVPGGRGPLSGLRVVELAGIGPAPFAAMLLADLGADVVRVDRVGATSPLDGDPRFDLLNRGKRSIAVDLKHPRGAELVLALAERANVLVEGYRPGVAERLGVGPEQALRRNPRLVYGRMTGWGQHGPLAQAAGHDINYVALSGALHAIGRAGGPPQVPVNLVGDFGGGALYLVVGVLAALRDADRSGRGQVVDAAIVDGAAHLTTMLHGLLAAGTWQDVRGHNLLDTGAPFYDVYATADGRHMSVGALEPRFYAEFIRLLGLAGDEDLPDRRDVSRWPLLRERIAAAFAARTRREWTEIFEGTDACVAPVLSLGEAAAHPHLAARGTFEYRYGMSQPAAAPRFTSPFPPSPAVSPRDPERSVPSGGEPSAASGGAGRSVPPGGAEPSVPPGGAERSPPGGEPSAASGGAGPSRSQDGAGTSMRSRPQAPPLPGEHSREILLAWSVPAASAWLASGAVRQVGDDA